MEVVKNNGKILECPKCNSKILYTYEDIITIQYNFRLETCCSFTTGFICPVCKTAISIIPIENLHNSHPIAFVEEGEYKILELGWDYHDLTSDLIKLKGELYKQPYSNYEQIIRTASLIKSINKIINKENANV